MRRSAQALVLAAAVLPLASGAFAQPNAPVDDDRVLRVCEDPNNLPFSNRAGEGFENKLAELLARELGWTLEYTWFPQRMGSYATPCAGANRTRAVSSATLCWCPCRLRAGRDH